MKKTAEKRAGAHGTSSKNASKKKSKINPVSNRIKKQYLKTNPMCKVTFKLPKNAAKNAEVVTIVGDFNDWNIQETPMKKLKSGDFKITLSLACNREYRFKYLIDSSRWENDWFADKYLPNDYGSDDSVVVINGNSG